MENKENEVMVNKTNYQINVSYLKACKDETIINDIINGLTNVETLAFKVAVRVAYLIGEKIPFNGMEIYRNKDKTKYSITDVATRISKSRPTISRWIKAFKYIRDNGLFEDFNTAVYPFSFDKIIIIFDNKLVTDEISFSDLMSKTVVELDKMAHPKTEETEETEETEVEASGDIVTFTYCDTTFKVDKAFISDFISKYCDIA